MAFSWGSTKTFRDPRYQQTLVTDFVEKRLETAGEEVTFHVWDTPGRLSVANVARGLKKGSPCAFRSVRLSVKRSLVFFTNNHQFFLQPMGSDRSQVASEFCVLYTCH